MKCLARLCSIVMLFLGFGAVAHGVEYTAHCEIEGDTAVGLVTVTSYDSLTISGDVVFRVFDEDGDLIDEDETYAYAYIYHDTEVVEEIDVDDDARFCTFDVSGAVEDDDGDDGGDGGDDTPRYSTFCELRGGDAHGYVDVPDFESLTISGYVDFYFYGEDGDLIDEESTYEYAYIYDDVELVASEDAPSDAVRCSFDVSGAISQ